MSIKKRIHEHCETILSNRINSIQEAINDAQSSANNESKSTAGDKHNTSRVVMQLEVEKLSKQLNQAQNQMRLINGIDPEKKSTSAAAGALISTNKGVFYMSTGIGKIDVDENSIMVISPASPIGQSLLSHKPGDTVSFNSIEYYIEEIF